MAVEHNRDRKQKYEQLIKGIEDDLNKQIMRLLAILMLQSLSLG
jgi:hypothetical protein